MARKKSFLRNFLKSHPRLVRVTLLTATFLVALGAGAAFGAWTLVCRGGACPSVDVLEGYQPRQTSKVYAVDGRFITELGVERRTLVTIDEIPPVVRDAFIVTEDKRFYNHSGIDWIRVPGAFYYNVRSGRIVQGFSTITMQLARNIFPDRISREKSLVRKLKEARVARAIEAKYSKDKILELYLNQINLGNGAYGVETASQRYFGKSVQALTAAEAAKLAALPKAPTRYNPRLFPERAIQRRNTVLELMRREKVISDSEASLAKAYPMQLASRSSGGDLAPYFVEWLRQELDDRFGRQLYEQGLRIYTTLDIDMQLAAERALESQLREVESGRLGAYRHVTYEDYVARVASGEERGSGQTPYLQGVLVALDAKTGAVRAMVGGRDFEDSKFNRATQALRQPGSTFKPIVFAEAVRRGYAPSHLVDDTPLTLEQLSGDPWTPQNFDLQFWGRVPMRRAIYNSRNLAAINTGRELGESSVIAMAHRMGITTEIPPYPSLHIGSADVRPLEMIASYTTFANMGTRAMPFGIVKVENSRGDVLYQASPRVASVLPRAESWLMVDMLRDVVRRGTAYRATTGSGWQYPAGGKTGTTNDGTDVWFIGFTSDLVAGVWMGFDSPKRIKANAQGGILAAPAWTAFMTEVYKQRGSPPADWNRPEELISREIDLATGLLAGPMCSGDAVTDWFIPGTEPISSCVPITSPFDFYSDSTAPRPSTLGRDTTDVFRIPPEPQRNP